MLEWRRGGRGLSATVSALSLFTSGEPPGSGNSQPTVKIWRLVAIEPDKTINNIAPTTGIHVNITVAQGLDGPKMLKSNPEVADLGQKGVGG